MNVVNIKVKFAFYDSDSYGWDYGDNHIQPYSIEVEGLNGDELNVIEPYNQKEIANIYRYVCYRLKLDTLSKKDFVRGFIDTVKKLEEEFNKKYVEVSDLTVYGVCTRDVPFFTPRNYEFIEKIEVKRAGNLDGTTPTRIKRLKSDLHSVYIDHPVIVTDGVEKGTLQGPDDYFIKYNLLVGDYSIYQIVDNSGKPLVSCLLKADLDFFEVKWEDQNGYNRKKEGDAVVIICTEYAVKKGLIANMDYVEETETDMRNYVAFPVRMATGNGSQYASYYVARQNGKAVGIAVDNVGYSAGCHKTIHELIHELT